MTPLVFKCLIKKLKTIVPSRFSITIHSEEKLNIIAGSSKSTLYIALHINPFKCYERKTNSSVQASE